MRAVACGLLISVLLGCRAPTTSTDGGRQCPPRANGGAAHVSIDEYCAKIVTATCAGLTCSGQAESAESCVAVLSRSPPCAAFGPGVRDGRIAFDGVAAAQCLSDWPSGAEPPESCARVFAALTPLGGSCYANEDCVRGTWCDASELVCPGQCRARAGVGATTTPCREDLVERHPFRHPTECVQRGALGEPCVIDAFTTTETCAAGLFCDFSVCRTRRQLDEECPVLPNEVCAQGLSCQRDEAGRWSCRPPAGLGQPCRTNFQPPRAECRLDLRCVDSVCSLLGTADQPCTHEGECGAGLFCVVPASFASVCGPGGGLGAFCSPWDAASCDPGLRCELENPVDGGFNPAERCVWKDGGGPLGPCVDATP